MKQSRGLSTTKSENYFQAKLATPFAILGVRTDEDWLLDIEYLPLDTPELPPQNSLAREICDQLSTYLVEPDFIFDLTLHIRGTLFQRRVWEVIRTIPCGKTFSYADIALKLNTSPRAVGGACGANKLPIIIPCHRVITKNGGLGGFMNARDGHPLAIKRWLLDHESGCA